ncbi:ATP11 protein-domain-containing protein [Mycena pura]|uniref:ATP11 protein-domain-containing protein n=1 Tax=Mycena pura TaxID=153505 RepID=A0AAD6YQ98_9AGAR|nr:ATP11 protein-domain-containing protein [Mycena pura]
MHLVSRVSRRVRSLPHIIPSPHRPRRFLHTNYEEKYSDKLRKAAQERGLSVSELKTNVKHEQEEQKRVATARSPAEREPSPFESVRRDSSPVKPLSSILNLPRILGSPHTAEQVSALWTVYHASRSNGTGRGYLCASIPLDLYTKMATAGAKYHMFVVPMQRGAPGADPVAPPPPPAEGDSDAAHEFYLLQWAFHDAPPVSSAGDADLFAPPSTPPPDQPANPQTSTIIFTPLQEYKLRGTFATPYLVLTNYTDLAQSHGVVLLRGEITPSAAAANAASAADRYLLRQADAARLSMAVQKFYLWDADDGSIERAKLVHAFHKTPNQFDWKELLKHAI